VKGDLEPLKLTVTVFPARGTDDWTDFLRDLSDFLCDKMVEKELSGFKIEVFEYTVISDVKADDAKKEAEK